MISTRSLLWDAVTAAWIEVYLHWRSSLMLKFRSFLAFFFLILIFGWEGWIV